MQAVPLSSDSMAMGAIQSMLFEGRLVVIKDAEEDIILSRNSTAHPSPVAMYLRRKV